MQLLANDERDCTAQHSRIKGRMASRVSSRPGAAICGHSKKTTTQYCVLHTLEQVASLTAKKEIGGFHLYLFPFKLPFIYVSI